MAVFYVSSNGWWWGRGAWVGKDTNLRASYWQTEERMFETEEKENSYSGACDGDWVLVWRYWFGVGGMMLFCIALVSRIALYRASHCVVLCCAALRR